MEYLDGHSFDWLLLLAMPKEWKNNLKKNAPQFIGGADFLNKVGKLNKRYSSDYQKFRARISGTGA
jgi:hypothetical protein